MRIFFDIHYVISFQKHIPNSISVKIYRCWSIVGILGSFAFSAILLGDVIALESKNSRREPCLWNRPCLTKKMSQNLTHSTLSSSNLISLVSLASRLRMSWDESRSDESAHPKLPEMIKIIKKNTWRFMDFAGIWHSIFLIVQIVSNRNFSKKFVVHIRCDWLICFYYFAFYVSLSDPKST